MGRTSGWLTWALHLTMVPAMLGCATEQDAAGTDAGVAADAGDADGSDGSDGAANVDDPGAGPRDGGDRDAMDTGDADGGEDNAAGVGLQAYCERTSAGYYDHLQNCYGTRPYPEERREEFVGEVRTRCLQAGPAVEAGRLGYDGVQASRCLDSLQPESCLPFASGPDCRAVFTGMSPIGGDCYREESLVFVVGTSTCAGGYCDQQLSLIHI